jgi:hypothetical protein
MHLQRNGRRHSARSIVYRRRGGLKLPYISGTCAAQSHYVPSAIEDHDTVNAVAGGWRDR